MAFGFLEDYSRAVRNTVLHTSAVSFIFTHVNPGFLDVEGSVSVCPKAF